MQGLLPNIREITEYFIFQQDGAPAHRVHDTVQLLETETPDFIRPTLWPPNSPDLNPVDYTIWSIMQEMVHKTKIRDVNELRQRIVAAWDEIDQRVMTSLYSSGASVFAHVLMLTEDTLNTSFDILLL